MSRPAARDEAAGRNWLNGAPRIASGLKSRVVRAGRAERSILLGPGRGLRMWLDLHHDTQLCLGLYEREIQCWLTHLASRARTLIDVGAAQGYYTLYFLARTHAERVLSVEPAAETRLQLLRNLELNGLRDDRRLRLLDAEAGARADAGELTLDGLRSEIVRPCLVKVDVDGGELAILKGGRELIEASGVSWLVEVHSAHLAAACASTLRQGGLEVRTVQNAWWRFLVPEMRPTAVNHWLVAFR